MSRPARYAPCKAGVATRWAYGDNGLGPLLLVSSGADIFPDQLLGNPNPTVEVLGEVRTFNVITRDQAAAVRADEVLYVTGTVQVFDLLEAERAVGYDLEDALFADRAGRPVLIADSLTPSTPTQ